MKPKIFLPLLLSFLILNSSLLISTVRYVSPTGSSTPPYTTWETAADSIMECINISVFGDTIYVANGTYKERVDMIPGLSLIGAGMDSCVIDTRELDPYYSVRVTDNCYFSKFRIISYTPTEGVGIVIYDFDIESITAIIEHNWITDAKDGIQVSTSSLGVDNNVKIIKLNLITDVVDGIFSEQTTPIISENIIFANEDGLVSQIISSPLYINNIVVAEIRGYFDLLGNSSIKNNLFYGNGAIGLDSGYDTIINNIVFGEGGNWFKGYNGTGSILKGKHFENTSTAIYYVIGWGDEPIVQYNNFWNNITNFENMTGDSTNIYSDPMFVNTDSLDFHLQMYSPLIDAGDPNILDKDGSRSDIGIWGGPYGEKYTYRDLAPKPPSNLTAVMDSGLVKLTWNKNTEADFYHYRVYRDTVPDFMYDTTKIIAVLADTIYFDDLPEKYLAGDYYYKITALDNTAHQSATSEEVHVNITGIPEAPPVVIDHYQLFNNYPNPFNPSTKIPYRLIKPGYVKLYVYDIKGEVVRVLVNGYQPAGYYEVEFKPNQAERERGKLSGEGFATGYNDDIATGIYIYQIMVRGEGDIPVFTDMGKMILLK